MHFCGFVRLLLYESAFEVARELKYCSARKLIIKLAFGLWFYGVKLHYDFFCVQESAYIKYTLKSILHSDNRYTNILQCIDIKNWWILAIRRTFALRASACCCAPPPCVHTNIHVCTWRLLINYKSFVRIRATLVVDDYPLDHRSRILLIITCLAGKSQLRKNLPTDDNGVPHIMTLCQTVRQSQVDFSFIKMSICVSFIHQVSK